MIYIDPVCKKKLRKKEEYAIVKYGDTAYHLCCLECKKVFEEKPEQYHTERQDDARQKEMAEPLFIDPVCGKHLRTRNHHLFTRYKGAEYRFCGKHCSERFKDNTAFYAEKHIQKQTLETSQVEAGAN